MSDKPKFDSVHAAVVAEQLRALLAPVCSRVEVAGSLRRGKAAVGDVELLYVPRMVLQKLSGDLFAETNASMADMILECLLREGVIAKRLSKAGVPAWGKDNKLAVHVASGIPVDFFSTTEDNWWVSLVIRTGSKETNLRLTQCAQALGRKLHAYGRGVEVAGEVMRCYSEQDVFDYCNVPYLEPEDR